MGKRITRWEPAVQVGRDAESKATYTPVLYGEARANRDAANEDLDAILLVLAGAEHANPVDGKIPKEKAH